MIKSFFTTSLFVSILAEDYFIGSSYTLNIPDGANITNDDGYQVSLVYGKDQDQELNIPGGENIKPGMPTAELGPINLYLKTDSLLINQSETGIIQVLNKNNSEIVLNQTVSILQSIMVENQLNNPVQTVGEQMTISGIAVSQQLYDSLNNITFYASIIDVSGDTWMPLQFFSESAESELKNSRRLLSKHLHTQFYPSRKPYILSSGITCDGEETYCRGDLTFDVPQNSFLGGPYIVNLMISDGNTSSNAFTVLGREFLIDGTGISDKDKLIVYSSSNVDILLKNMTLKNMTNPVQYYYYERGDVNINIENLTESVCLYITLKDDEEHEYIARCDSATKTDFTVLDWRFKENTNLRDGGFNITNGTYEVNIYLDADCEGELNPSYIFELNAENTLSLSIQEYQDNTTGPVIIQPVNIQNIGQYIAGDTASFEIFTSFSLDTTIEYYFETCEAINNCTILNTTNGPPMSFNYTMDNIIISVALPGTLKVTKPEYNITNNIVFLIPSCDGETVLETKQELEIIEKPDDGGSSNTLSAGAIVGIVCAGVLVCGLAAWWICMRKSQGDGYRQLDE